MKKGPNKRPFRSYREIRTGLLRDARRLHGNRSGIRQLGRCIARGQDAEGEHRTQQGQHGTTHGKPIRFYDCCAIFHSIRLIRVNTPEDRRCHVPICQENALTNQRLPVRRIFRGNGGVAAPMPRGAPASYRRTATSRSFAQRHAITTFSFGNSALALSKSTQASRSMFWRMNVSSRCRAMQHQGNLRPLSADETA